MVLRCLVLSLAVCVGCSDNAQSVFYPDLQLKHDTTAPFLAPCTNDSDCAAGHCLDINGAKKCSKTCNQTSPCPVLQGWSCNSKSFCECSYTGKKPTVCNVDGDCDGVPDRPIKDEICNNEDDDCNNITDDVKPGAEGSKKYYRDADGDGYGDTNNVKWLCKAEEGWVEKDGDCDDTRKDTHPDAPELCGDDRDNNCNGTRRIRASVV
jgi:hypothetical protein